MKIDASGEEQANQEVKRADRLNAPAPPTSDKSSPG